MFSSNIGFRRRTVSEGYHQLLAPPPSASKRGSSSSQRHSLDESSSSTTVKRIVLRKHSSDSSKSRGLADRIASGEIENIEGFWSRRLSDQRRNVPSSPKQLEPNVAEWRREARGRAEALSKLSERSQASPKPRGPRPLSKVQVTSPRSSYLLSPSDYGNVLSAYSHSDIMQLSIGTTPRMEGPVKSQLSIPPSRSLVKANGRNKPPTIDQAQESRLTYRPLLPPGLPILKKPSNKPAAVKAVKRMENKAPSTEKRPERKRFAQLEITLRKLVGGRKAHSNQIPSNDPTVFNPIILPPLIPIPPIPIPPIPEDTDTKRVSRPKSVKSVKSVKSNKSSKSRKSSRKRKTGLARIVVELAKGEKVVAVDAEAIQEATEVRDILAQLRQMKAA